MPLRSEVHIEETWKVTVEVFADDVLCATGEVVGVVAPASFTNK